MEVWYCTREQVKGALGSNVTARDDYQVDRAVASSSRETERCLHRRFYPQLGTRFFDWPGPSYSRPWRLWLDDNEVISVTTLVAGGVTISPADYNLEPANYGPPFTYIEINRASSVVFAAGTTPQRAIAVTGLFGHSADEEAVGQLGASLAASLTATTATIIWTTPRIGVGDILKIDSERMIVSSKTFIDSTQNLATPLTAAVANVTVAVADGTAFKPDDVLLLDSERMLVVDVAGNNLTVKRAYDGSVLAAHAGSDVFVRRGVELARAQLGTALAAHSVGAEVTHHLVPSLVRDLTIAQAIDQIMQEQGAYARTSGSGDNQRELAAVGLKRIRDDAYGAYGRKARIRAV